MHVEQSLKKVPKASERESTHFEPFRLALAKNGLKLERGKTKTLQLNVGLLCNQTCRHCHLNAGPDRKEMLNSETMDEVVAYAQRCQFDNIDITGGAPELNSNIVSLIEELRPWARQIMLRSNLTALMEGKRNYLIDVLKKHQVVIVASLPSLNKSQTESQRGQRVFGTLISGLKKLNAVGYGRDGTSLELNLVSNPTGAFLPPAQGHAENRFRQVLDQKWGIVFNNLFNFANVPVGRFRDWLLRSGNFEQYMYRLASNFNPCTIEGVMCRTLVSVSWDGYLYDCDFNLAKGLFLGGRQTHVSEMSGPPEPGSTIATSDHCYTCTAGAGFT
jgi:radical SAM/Cys-rich protein